MGGLIHHPFSFRREKRWKGEHKRCGKAYNLTTNLDPTELLSPLPAPTEAPLHSVISSTVVGGPAALRVSSLENTSWGSGADCECVSVILISGLFSECSSLPPRELRLWELFQWKRPKTFCFFFSVFAVKIDEASSYLSCFVVSSLLVGLFSPGLSGVWRGHFRHLAVFMPWFCFPVGGRAVGIRGRGGGASTCSFFLEFRSLLTPPSHPSGSLFPNFCPLGLALLFRRTRNLVDSRVGLFFRRDLRPLARCSWNCREHRAF